MKKLLRVWILLCLPLAVAALAVNWQQRSLPGLDFLHLDWIGLLAWLAALSWARVKQLKLEARPGEGLALQLLALATAGPFFFHDDNASKLFLKALVVLGLLALGGLAQLSLEFWEELGSYARLPAWLRRVLGAALAFGILVLGLGESSQALAGCVAGFALVACLLRMRSGQKPLLLRGLGLSLLGLRLSMTGPVWLGQFESLGVVLALNVALWSLANLVWEKAFEDASWRLATFLGLALPAAFLSTDDLKIWAAHVAALAGLSWLLRGNFRHLQSWFEGSQKPLKIWKTCLAVLALVCLAEGLGDLHPYSRFFAEGHFGFEVLLPLVGALLRKFSLGLSFDYLAGLSLCVLISDPLQQLLGRDSSHILAFAFVTSACVLYAQLHLEELKAKASAWRFAPMAEWLGLPVILTIYSYFGWEKAPFVFQGMLLMALAGYARKQFLGRPVYALRALNLFLTALAPMASVESAGQAGLMLLSVALVYVFWEKAAESWKKALALMLGSALPAGLAFFGASWLVAFSIWGGAVGLWLLWRLSLRWVSRKVKMPAMPAKLLRPMPAVFGKLSVNLKAGGEQGRKQLAAFGKTLELFFSALGLKLAAFLARKNNLKRVGMGLGIVLLVLLSRWAYVRSVTSVLNFTPEGEVASSQTVIQAVFSDDVTANGDLGAAIQVTPAIPGRVFLADPRTLIFSPESPLKPATHYKATLNTAALKSSRWHMQGSESTAFNTPDLKVGDLRLFYDMDILGQTETELVGELNFNYPIDPAALRTALTVVKKGGAQLKADLEAGTLPSQFYFKASGFTREDKSQTFVVTVAKGLRCTECDRGLDSDVSKEIELPARPEMTVEEVKLHHVPGNSMVAVRFSLPLTNAEARAHIRLAKKDKDGKFASMPVEVDSEYAYALLKAKFEPNATYQVTIDGIRAVSGQLLKEKHEESLTLEDAPASLRLADEGHYLPESGSKQIEVQTMNLDNFDVQVDKIYRNNIVNFLANGSAYQYGRKVFDGQVEVKGGQINEEVPTRLDVGNWQAAPYKGLFNVALRGRDYETRADTWLLCTDLGLLAKRSGRGLWVQVLSVKGLQPVAGVQLDVMERRNQVLQSAVSDAQGRAFFKDVYPLEAGEWDPFVLVATKADDYSFLRLDGQGLDTARFDTGGDATNNGGFDAWVTSERGLYRPGESAHFTAIARKANLEGVNLPLTLEVTGPDGSSLYKEAKNLDAEGAGTWDLDLNASWVTGAYQARVWLQPDKVLATAEFKVEEFIPNKIQAEVAGPKNAAQAGGKLAYTVKARQLFGAPAANLQVQSGVELEAKDFSPADYDSYHFNDPSRSYEAQELKVPAGKTDGSGKFPVELDLPASVLPASMLSARIFADVFDSGGRPVGGYARVDVHRYSAYIGLKTEGGKNLVVPSRIKLDYVVLGVDGKPLKGLAGQHLIVKRRTWYSIFRKQGFGGRGYESEYYDEVVENRKVSLNAKGTLSFEAQKAGEYTVLLGDERSMRTGLVFAAAGSSDAEAVPGLDNADHLAMSLDKRWYNPGDMAQVEVRAPFPGRLLLSIERDGIYQSMQVQVPAGRSLQALPVDARDLPNAYVVGLLVRAPEERYRGLPMTSFGVIPLPMDHASSQLGLHWDAPEETRSSRGVDVSLAVGEPGTDVVLAAVDEGILQIISFVTPDPFTYFYRKRKLETSTLSLFDEVLPDLARKMAAGGGDDEGFVRRHLNPVAARKDKSFARFSGILRADANGMVHWHADTDGFQGEVRVMALALKGKRFGAHAWSVRVSDPLVMQPNLPRFVAPGDSFDIAVQVFNQTEKAQQLTVSLATQGPVDVTTAPSQSFKLEAKGQKHVVFRARAKDDAGAASFKFEAVAASGESASKTSELPVRPSSTLHSVVKAGSLAPGQELGLNVPGDYISFGRKIRFKVSANPLAEFEGSLDYLLRYPYGCGEQLTSQLFPLLAAKELGLDSGRFSLKGQAASAMELDKFIQSGIKSLVALEDAQGGFRLWDSDTQSNAWLSNYSAHCLLTASLKGYSVPEEALARIHSRLGAIQVGKKAIGRLDRREDDSQEDSSEGADAYMHYLKALAGSPDLEGMKSLKEELLKNKDKGLDRSLLSLAYATAGDKPNALSLLEQAPDMKRVYRESGGRWDSSNRDLAVYLLALATADAPAERLRPLVDEFSRRMKAEGQFGTTQENAWAFMALAQACKRIQSLEAMQASYKVGAEQASHSLTKDHNILDAPELFGKKITLKNEGQGPLYYCLIAEGTPLHGPTDAEESGMSISREYRDEDGKEVNPGAVAQGQLVVVTLRVKAKKPLENAVVVDLLPGGFEVDNPRLKSRGHLGFDPDSGMDVHAMDIRDDRVLLFPQAMDGEQAFSYSVRAVTPGTWELPSALTEAMYDPDTHARSPIKGKLVIAPANE